MEQSSEARISGAVFTFLSGATGTLVSLIGFLGIIGHLLDSHLLKSFRLEAAPEISLIGSIMLVFLGIGAGLILSNALYPSSSDRNRFLPALLKNLSLLIPGGIALFLFFLYLIQSDWNPLLLLFYRVSQTAPSFLTIVQSLIAVVGLILLDRRKNREGLILYVVSVLALLLLNISVFSLAGHWFELPILYNFQQSLPSAIAFTLLSIGLLFGVLPFKGLLSPLMTSRSPKLRMLASFGFVCSIAVLLYGIYIISEFQALPANQLDPESRALLDTNLMALESATIALAILVQVFSLRIVSLLDKAFLSEQALRESEQRFRAVADDAPVIIWMMDEKGMNTYVNKAGLRLTGYSAEPALKIADWFKTVHPDERQQELSKFMYHFETRQLYKSEFRLQDLTGMYHWVTVQGSPRYAPNGKFMGYIGTCIDITEQKQAKKALEDSLKELSDIRHAVDESSIIAITDKNGTMTYVNDAFCKISKYSREELIGQNHRMMKSDHHPPSFYKDFWITITQGRIWRGEVKNRAKDGSYYWLDTTVVPFLDSHGEPFQYIAIRHDITSKKQAEESLKMSEQRLRLLVENVKDYAIFMLNPAGQIMTWNKGAKRVYGYSAEEIIGQHISRFYPQGDVWLGKPDYELQLAQTDVQFEDEDWRIRKDGSSFMALVNTTALYDETGNLIGFSKIVRDVSERTQLEEQVRQAKKEAELAEMINQKKNLFFAVMSHELRTPLNAIIGFSDMLEGGFVGPLTEKQKSYVHNVAISGRHLLEMVNDILDLSKIEAGRLMLHPEFLHLPSLIKDIRGVVSHLGMAKNVEVEFSVANDLQGIEADSTRLRQILFNLISNAIKFNREGGRVKVAFQPSEDKKWVVCRVEDTGIGIPQAEISSLFTEFYQIDTSPSRSQQGTGLGLALTKRLVELHGGFITVESIEGVGTTFKFALPLKIPAQAATATDTTLPI